MATQLSNEFKQILTAAKERRGDLNVDTMIVSSHLAQMRMFMLRRGVEFYADQDNYGGQERVHRQGLRAEHARHEAGFDH